jgi:RNA polymerase sigma-70 factor, ECF subfamily
MTTTDLELAEKARRGDRNAFRQLLERHYDSVYRVAFRFAGSVLVDKLRSFRGDSQFSTCGCIGS